MLQEIFDNKVKQFRMKKAYHRMTLSLLAGIDRPQISKIEQGKINATLETLVRISNALGIKSPKLLDSKKDLHSLKIEGSYTIKMWWLKRRKW